MIALDTFALLRSIAGAPEIFCAVEPDLEKVAVASVKKLLKSKKMTLDGLRALNRVIDTDTLGFVLGHDSMKDSEITALVRKLDKHWPMLASARLDLQRDRLLDLASGEAQPAEKVAPPPRPTRNAVPRAAGKKSPQEKSPGLSRSMGARPQKVD
jgi:hypothetical protein